MTKPSSGRLLIAALVILSLAAVAGGFLVIGSPATQRQLALDRQRSLHLLQIATAVNAHWRATEELPAGLDALANAWAQQKRDPETDEAYDYEATGERTYRLCAVFARTGDAAGDTAGAQPFEAHGAGRHCFDLDAAQPAPMMGVPSILVR
jgi:hypothetical protein